MTSGASVPPEPSTDGGQASFIFPVQGQETLPGDRNIKRCDNDSTESACRGEISGPYAVPPLPPSSPAQVDLLV